MVNHTTEWGKMIVHQGPAPRATEVEIEMIEVIEAASEEESGMIETGEMMWDSTGATEVEVIVMA